MEIIFIIGVVIFALFITLCIEYLMSYKTRNIYLITIEYTKYPNKQWFKSQQRAGTKVNNQFTQFTIELNKPEDLIQTIGKDIKSKNLSLHNWKITKIVRIG